MNQSIVVKNLIRDVVAKVSTDITAQLQDFDSTITGVHYMNGHPLEIANRLAERENDNVFKYKKYPLISLFMDFPENKGNQFGYFNVSLNLIIARSTSGAIYTDERYEKNFIPVLYPIYDAFLKTLIEFSYGKYKAFNNSEVQTLQHTKIDRVFWGTESFMANQSNYFKDYIDAIEIRNLELSVNFKNC